MITLPSVNHTKATDLKATKTAITNYLKRGCFTAKEIKSIFVEIDNLEWSKAYCEKFVKGAFPGKKFADDRSRITAAFVEYHTIVKAQASKMMRGY